MEKELKEVKSMLRSLVVSSAAAVDAATLARDYRRMLGEPLPFSKFGYRDQLTFLRERCSDCFLFQGPVKNPTLTLIVPDSLKHIDKFVQKQRTAGVKSQCKRRSVPESVVKPRISNTSNNTAQKDCLILNTFKKKTTKPDIEVSKTSQACSVDSFLRKRMPMLETLRAAESEQNTKRLETLRTKHGSAPAQVAGSDWTPPSQSPAPAPAPGAAPAAAASPAPAARRFIRSRFFRPASPPPDIDDALPGVPYEANVFPEDCMHYMESIPSVGVADLQVKDVIDVITAEVYSPSHLWLIRLGAAYNEAMEAMMDDMNEYYRGAGRDRELVVGAVRAGHHVAACYLGDWHRALIVRLVDCDTVKVRHVDYGTVQELPARELRPLRRCWAALPAQAVRARLAGLRPAAAARRWHVAAAARLLRLLRDRPLAATVAARDLQEESIEVYLSDWTGGVEVQIHRELIASGHAEGAEGAEGAAAGGASAARAVYEWPTFSALEAAATPTLDELLTFLRMGIDPDCVHEYSAHVPPLLPPLSAPSPPPRPSAPAASPPPSPLPSPAASPAPSPAASPPTSPAASPAPSPLPSPAPSPSPLPSPPTSPSHEPLDAEPVRSPSPRVELPTSPATTPPVDAPSACTARSSRDRPQSPPQQKEKTERQRSSPQNSGTSDLRQCSSQPYLPCQPRPPLLPLPSYPSPGPRVAQRPRYMPSLGMFGPQPFVGPFVPVFPGPPPPGFTGPPPPGFPGPPPGFPAYQPRGEASVTLSMTECEVFALLARIRPGLARQFVAERCQRASPLNPLAPEFTLRHAAAPPANDTK